MRRGPRPPGSNVGGIRLTGQIPAKARRKPSGHPAWKRTRADLHKAPAGSSTATSKIALKDQAVQALRTACQVNGMPQGTSDQGSPVTGARYRRAAGARRRSQVSAIRSGRLPVPPAHAPDVGALGRREQELEGLVGPAPLLCHQDALGLRPPTRSPPHPHPCRSSCQRPCTGKRA